MRRWITATTTKGLAASAVCAALGGFSTPATAQPLDPTGFVDALVAWSCEQVRCDAIIVEGRDPRVIQISLEIPSPIPFFAIEIDQVTLTHSAEPTRFSEALPRRLRLEARGLRLTYPRQFMFQSQGLIGAVQALVLDIVEITFGGASALAVSWEETEDGLFGVALQATLDSGDEISAAVWVRIDPSLPTPPQQPLLDPALSPEMQEAAGELVRLGLTLGLMPVDRFEWRSGESRLFDTLVTFALLYIDEADVVAILTEALRQIDAYAVVERRVGLADAREITISAPSIAAARRIHRAAVAGLLAWRDDWRDEERPFAMTLRPNSAASLITLAAKLDGAVETMGALLARAQIYDAPDDVQSLPLTGADGRLNPELVERGLKDPVFIEMIATGAIPALAHFFDAMDLSVTVEE